MDAGVPIVILNRRGIPLFSDDQWLSRVPLIGEEILLRGYSSKVTRVVHTGAGVVGDPAAHVYVASSRLPPQ